MILYVNGDSHTAAAELANPHAFAEDDGMLGHLGRRPHPDNLEHSWGRVLSSMLNADFYCDAESASSNARILRTTRQWIKQNRSSLPNTFMIIQWSTWERQEWLIDGEYYQLTASGIDDVPPKYQQQYKNFVLDVNWHECRRQAHEDIWHFHCELVEQEIQHIFFSGNNHFGDLPEAQRRPWGTAYVEPYNGDMTYDQWLRINNYATVSPNSWHFGQDAHRAWAKFMLQYIVRNQFLKTILCDTSL